MGTSKKSLVNVFRNFKDTSAWYNKRMVPKLDLPPSLHLPDLLRFRRSATVRHGLDELQKFISFELNSPTCVPKIFLKG